MDKAVDRVKQAVFKKEMICVYGDYDVDGTTGASILYQFFKEIGALAFFYIPHRLKEGYGLTPKVIEELKAQNAKLVITCDCGTANQEEVAAIQAEGIDVIVTDHHKVKDSYPPAHAFLNHQRPDCSYPEKTLSGVGVAFNLIMAVRTTLRASDYFKEVKEPDLKEYLDLVALGTISDMVPLYGANRILIVNGLRTLNSPKRIGMKALIESAGLKQKHITAQSIAFGLAPRINAGGRIDSARVIIELFTTDDPERARFLAEYLEKKNSERRQIQERIFREANFFIQTVEGRDLKNEISLPESSSTIIGKITPHSIVVGSSSWHAGVIGIVASKLVEKYYRPAIVIALDNETQVGKGSCRSIENFDITKALTECASFLIQFGGHPQAAGLSVKKDDFLKFASDFDRIVSQKTAPDHFIPLLKLDMETDIEEMTEDFVRELKYLEPFGVSNPEPIFGTKNLKISSSKVVGEKHLKLYVKGKSQIREAILFNKADIIKNLSDILDLAYVPELNEWRGTTTVQLRVKDLVC